jgi:hypothetical protein
MKQLWFVGALLASFANFAQSADGERSSLAQIYSGYHYKLTPTDEALRDPSLRALRDAMLRAADARDVARLRPLLAAHVWIDREPLSPSGAIAAIAAYPRDDRIVFWQDLREALRLGFIRQDGDVCAPYAVFQIPQQAYGSFTPLGIVAAGVRIRREPSVDSPIVDTLSYDIVAAEPGDRKPEPSGEFGGVYEWYPVRTSQGALGWVLSKYVREGGARRFCFTKERGRWKLSSWGFGD